jgi:hypothetical protein
LGSHVQHICPDHKKLSLTNRFCSSSSVRKITHGGIGLHARWTTPQGKSMAGSTLSNPAIILASINAGRDPGSAPAARAPGRAAGAAAPEDAAAAPAAATTAASATATTATAASATPSYLYAVTSGVRAFFVEHIERSQTDVGNFLLTQRELMVR